MKIVRLFLLGLLFFELAFANKTVSDVDKNDYLASLIYWSLDKEIFKPIDAHFKRREAVTKREMENAFSTIRCKHYPMKSLEGRYGSQYVKKSEMVRELSFLITANMPRKNKRITLPAGWEKVEFKDLKRNTRHYKAAQILVSLGVLELNNGYFGIPPKNAQDPGDADPGVLRADFLEILDKSFYIDQCNFFVKLDSDSDGVENLKDFCPGIPGKGKDGCPQFKQRKGLGVKDDLFHVFPGPGLLNSSIKILEEAEIRLGDFIFAAILNPRTQDIITRSKLFLVEH